VAGFESFNRDLYVEAASDLPVHLTVFADTDIRIGPAVSEEETGINPVFAKALENADAFIGSLIFDYDDVLAVKSLLERVTGPRLIFESATELMEYNSVGTFNMKSSGDGPSGPPPAVKAIISKFSSGKEEDKITGYLKMLKVGPELLKFVPGEKAGDLRTWLESYRYWNQGGKNNVRAMMQIVAQRCSKNEEQSVQPLVLPELEVTPDIGVLHPLKTGPNRFFDSPASFVKWRLSADTAAKADKLKFKLAPSDSPRVAILLYRKHVITEQRYINDLITMLEGQGILPIPIFINGVEAHTIVRDLLTSTHEIKGVANGKIVRDSSYQSSKAARVDAIVSTIGFPLVGGPAGSMEAGRNVHVAETLLRNMNVPYFIASPLLLQSIPQWKKDGVLGLQSVVLYSLPELDGAIDTVVLGGLVGDKIALVPERVRKLASRVSGWVSLRRTPPKDRRIAISIYGFPPNVGAVGTAALLDVPGSLDALLRRLDKEGYDVGSYATDADASGESLVAALATLSESGVIAKGADRMQDAVDAKIERAQEGDPNVAETLSKPGGGLGGARVRAIDVTRDELEKTLGRYMSKKVLRAWSEKERGPGVSSKGDFVVSGLEIGNVWITVQPLLGVEGDPMRLLFERDLTPHPQYCAAYEWTRKDEVDGGIGAQAVIHLGMHGTVEWLPGQPLGNDRQSWSDELMGNLPNIYVYAVNNPSESILAKRRGYGTLVSYNVPPYGRAGLYLELATLNELVTEYRSGMGAETEADAGRKQLRESIWSQCQRSGLLCDVPLQTDPNDVTSVVTDSDLPDTVSTECFDMWVGELSNYLVELQDRLFSSGLHTLGSSPTDENLASYLQAYFGDRLTIEEAAKIVTEWHKSVQSRRADSMNLISSFLAWIESFDKSTDSSSSTAPGVHAPSLHDDASLIVSLLSQSTEELDSVINALDGGYVPALPGGDLLRDGPAVLPTGRNIHALDPYRMPSAGAWARGQLAANEILKQHRAANNGEYPETIAVTLWGLDAIKTRGESVAIVLALVGAEPVKEGTGRIVRFDLVPLEELSRPRIDVLASLSGIFRDSFANIVDLLDDMFERAASADEPVSMNFIKKHAVNLKEDGVERPAARLFSNPPGDYGSMVNEIVGTGDWDDADSLGETWKGRNSFSYGRSESKDGSPSGTARPEVLDLLLKTTDRVVQEIDSVEYGMTDIQEYYANTGALKKAAENRKQVDPKTGKKKRVNVSVIEAFGGDSNSVPVREVDDVLRLEYRSKLLNPKWRDAMLDSGGGAYEISQRMTAMVGWAATADVDNFVFDQAADRYALDEEIARKLQKSNPEAFKNVVRRLLEAAGRGMWSTDDETLDKLRDLYSDADDLIEKGT
jgi:magnesium chelatase subunit H